MGTAADAPARAAPSSLALVVRDRPVPRWTQTSGATVVEITHPETLDGIDEAISATECVLVDAASPHFVSLARRVHALDASVQVVAVADAEQVPAARRALLYAPGLGEVWIASPTEVNNALAER
ncbi:MAG: hypothetical protein H0X64_15780, partial [Gemmatimonadaceae bacterium]|nr:hypothetical protein [Gemmatimonadaceae bacterium]